MEYTNRIEINLVYREAWHLKTAAKLFPLTGKAARADLDLND